MLCRHAFCSNLLCIMFQQLSTDHALHLLVESLILRSPNHMLGRMGLERLRKRGLNLCRLKGGAQHRLNLGVRRRHRALRSRCRRRSTLHHGFGNLYHNRALAVSCSLWRSLSGNTLPNQSFVQDLICTCPCKLLNELPKALWVLLEQRVLRQHPHCRLNLGPALTTHPRGQAASVGQCKAESCEPPLDCPPLGSGGNKLTSAASGRQGGRSQENKPRNCRSINCLNSHHGFSVNHGFGNLWSGCGFRRCSRLRGRVFAHVTLGIRRRSAHTCGNRLGCLLQAPLHRLRWRGATTLQHLLAPSCFVHSRIQCLK